MADPAKDYESAHESRSRVATIMPFDDNSKLEAPSPFERRAGNMASSTGSIKSQKTQNTTTAAKRSEKDVSSELRTFVNLFKGNLGTGVLALPQALYYAGLWVGLAGIPVLGAICVHCMHLLLQSSRALCDRLQVPALNMEDTAHQAFATGPLKLRSLAEPVTLIIKVFLVFTQIGFCCVYYVFVVSSLYQLIECLTGGTGLTLLMYNLLLFIPFMLVSSIQHLKSIAFMSMASSVCHVVSLCIILYYCVRDLHAVSSVPAFGGWHNMPLFFGTAIFTFEGIGLILPIENRMKHPQRFGGPLGVLNTCMTTLILMYMTVAFFGYLQYGNSIQGSITLNLPPDERLAQVVKLLVAVSILFSYPLQLYVPVLVFMNAIARTTDSYLVSLAKEYSIRVVTVIFSMCLSVAVPNVGLFISLVGAVSSSTLALILPPLVHLVTFWPNTGPFHLIVVKACCIVGIGLLGFGTGTFASIVAIKDYFELDNTNGTTLICV